MQKVRLSLMKVCIKERVGKKKGRFWKAKSIENKKPPHQHGERTIY